MLREKKMEENLNKERLYLPHFAALNPFHIYRRISYNDWGEYSENDN
jgi:hypothetical protein